MFDFGFSELGMIGAVALVVLGPERLPVVARTAGQWLGKAQRMVQQVKNDIEREAELSELKKIQEEAKSVADDLTKTVKGQIGEIESSVKAVEDDVNAAAKEMVDQAQEAKSAFADLENASTSSGDLGSAFDKPAESTAADTSANTTAESDSTVSDFYDWYGGDDSYSSSEDETPNTTFEKRYKSGPSLDELAEQVERLKAELGDRSPQLGGNNRRLAVRAKSNRVRIYR